MTCHQMNCTGREVHVLSSVQNRGSARGSELFRMVLFIVYLLLSSLNSLTEATSAHLPRMTITDKGQVVIMKWNGDLVISGKNYKLACLNGQMAKCTQAVADGSSRIPHCFYKDAALKRIPFPEHHVPEQIFLGGEADTVTTFGKNSLTSFNFQSPQKAPVNRKLQWECMDRNPQQQVCSYNISIVHQREGVNQPFVCGTDDRETVCCDVNFSEKSAMCMTTEKIKHIKESIKELVIKDGAPYVLVESEEHTDLYITHSGNGEYIGIHRFGRNRVGPANRDKEQHYVGMMLSRRPENPLQDRVYTFYNEKMTDADSCGDIWIPFVSRVCMADVGGPKSTLQYTWTSQMNARLFCGDPESKRHFSELVDVATDHADRWQDTRVYALFRNEWGMSAVCVYTIEDIDHVFKTSPFKGEQGDRPRECVRDSTKLPSEKLSMLKTASVMQHLIQPATDSGPFVFKHHIYTHILVHSFHQKNNQLPVLFLSLNKGGIHKVINNRSQTFIIAEYQPFMNRDHVLSMILHPSSRQLYVSSRSELVQLDVANCSQYGRNCEECVLARNPYCGWNDSHCTPNTRGTKQDVAGGDHTICTSVSKDTPPGIVFRSPIPSHAIEDVDSVSLPSHSRYFLQCPMSSHHAKYTWLHNGSSSSCDGREHQCLLLIESMGPEQEGNYTCVLEEMGYSRVLARYQLKLMSRAVGFPSSPLVWFCLIAVLVKDLSVQA